MLIVVAVLSIILICALVYNVKIKQDIKHISKQLEEMSNIETNRNVTSLTLNKALCYLASNINKMINEQKEELMDYRRKDKELKQLITNISHDLRTPLTSASGYVQILKNEEIEPKKQAEYLGIVEQRMLALNKLLNTFFELSRLQSDEYVVTWEKVNLSEVLCETIALFYEEFVSQNRAPVIHVPDKPIFLICDKIMLERILQNLIQNSLIHGNGETKITLDAKSEFIQISFSNAIQGKIETERLFERFYTADKSRNSGTTGLGLAVVKKMVEKNNGSIRAKQEGERIEFVICLKN